MSNRTIHRILISIFFFYNLLFLYPQNIDISPKTIFEEIKRVNRERMPLKYHAKVTSELIDKQMGTIPKENIIFGKTPYLVFEYQRSNEPKLILENVDEYYIYTFSVFEELFQQTGVFLGIDNVESYPSFIKNYMMYWYKGKEAPHVNLLKMVEKDALDGDYAKYFLTEDWVIEKCEFYEQNKLILTISISYTSFKKYVVPLTFKFEMSQKESKSFSLNFSEFSLDLSHPKLFAPTSK